MKDQDLKPTYPAYFWIGNGGQTLAYHSSGHVCRLDESTDSGLALLYQAPPDLVHFVPRHGYPYIYAYSAIGECYTLDSREARHEPKGDVKSLQHALAEEEQRQADLELVRLENAKADREKAQRMLESKRDELAAQEAALSRAAEAEKATQGTYGAKVKAAKAAAEQAAKVEQARP